MMKLKLSDIARIIGGDIVAPEGAERIDITGVARIEGAGPGEITFVAAPQYHKFLATTRASAVIVTPDLARDAGGAEAAGKPGSHRGAALLQVDDPYRAFMKLMGEFASQDEEIPAGIHPTAIVPATATIHPEVRIGPYVVLGERVTVGAGTWLWPHVVLGSGVTVGVDCRIYASVSVREGCQLGSRVIIHAGAVIGADGFGFLPAADGGREKVPQVGCVRVEDDVEIGANTTIDRATVDQTIVRRGAKIDNLVQIAHNVEVGENSCLAAQVGVSGSTRIGARNLVGGQVGFAGHMETGDDVIVIAQTGVSKSITRPGIYGGSPHKEHGDWMRTDAALRRLPDALRKLRELERRLEAVESRSAGVTE
jgi:UDP-3-O-[3-hydroxymyristoyl] glucosamine N-acyltransferase